MSLSKRPSGQEKTMDSKIDIIITRHQPLVDLAIERGWVDADTPVGPQHAGISDVKGKHVFGVLPHHLSQHAASVTEVDMSAATLDDRKSMARGDIPIERMREIAGQPDTYEVFGGSPSSRDRDIVRASEERGRGGWSRHRQAALLWRVLAEFMSGVRRWHGKPVTGNSALLCATAISCSGQSLAEGPILHADHRLRRGWDEDAPLVNGPQLSWSGDGNHAGAEVDLLRMGVRIYASGPDWSDWAFPFGEIDITPRG